jgi:hypothetical protein
VRVESAVRYVEISDGTLRVNVGKSADTSLLEINVEIDRSKVEPVSSGRVARPRPLPTMRLEPESQVPWVKPG